MKWEGEEESRNIDDRRGMKKAGMAVGGGSIIVIIIALLTGGDISKFLGGGQQPAVGGGGPGKRERPLTEGEKKAKRFVAVTLKYTEDVWNKLFRQMNRTYEEPVLVLFTGAVDSACGSADASVGPFYCPGDNKVYIDLTFFDELAQRFKAPGDFAQAYVIAHEIGHHVQNLLGISTKVHKAQRGLTKTAANQLSVRLELQADYLAGVWAHHIQKSKRVLDPGDINEALRAANAIGDDRLQKNATGRVVPDSFTHGTSEQRIRWFRKGFETGDVSKMNDLFNMRYEDL